jgi:hypothetical protein
MYGLKEIGQEFFVNQPFSEEMDKVCVLSGVEVLKKAIQQKKLGKINTLIAGPNIVVHPNEAEGILKSSEIDCLIVPSLWVKDFYISLAPELKNKIQIWASGVADQGSKLATAEEVFVYDKSPNGCLPEKINQFLQAQGQRVNYQVYGKINHETYLAKLKKTAFMVYLSGSESQGLALFEAWMANVPTLVWDRGYMQYKNLTWQGNTSAPYLSKETGLFFRDLEDFKEKYQYMLAHFAEFNPRAYMLENFTNKITTEKFLKLISL